ncbi:hypothetical protein PH210_21145 [Paenibacillus sp. BSR1-1]|uniref:hypothetical protein n=1 Tax=Paenibacillus sp. BSR1-1 TaxID=3020845 RepID=UPI0025B01F42|nr:hypothetical protein [Paenibacillus sp. BSR1-1]MDN3018697.1 hypothetical protein [Paenibacillus sp. BSR1-1]
MLLQKRKESTEDSQVKLVAYTIILYISSLFVPFIVVASYQSMVYYSRNQWFFTTPLSAYITFAAGMLIIAFALTVYLIFRQRSNGSGLKWVTWVLILGSIPVFVMSLTNYYFFDEKGIHYNSLTKIREEDYEWDKIKKIHIVYRNHQGTTSILQYQFESRNGREITIPFNDKLSENKWRVEKMVKENNILVTDNFKNPITD